jgi:hypothetical protein
MRNVLYHGCVTLANMGHFSVGISEYEFLVSHVAYLHGWVSVERVVQVSDSMAAVTSYSAELGGARGIIWL